MNEHGRIEVFYDGTCPMCRASRRWAERHDSNGSLVFCELNDSPAVSGPAAADGRGGAMWVRLPGGETASGYAGWLTVLRALPRWRFLARVLGLPPVRWAGPAVYRFVAGHRHVLANR